MADVLVRADTHTLRHLDEVDRAKMAATTEEDIRRHKIEDGEDPDAPPLAFSKRKPGQRGPGKRPAKVLVSIRLDPDVLKAWQASGPGWQVRANEVMRQNAPATLTEADARGMEIELERVWGKV